MQSNVSSQHQIGPFLREVFMAIVNRIFTVLGKPADEKDVQVRYKVSLGILDLIWHGDKSSPYTAVLRINKLTSIFYASGLLLIMNFIITLSK